MSCSLPETGGEGRSSFPTRVWTQPVSIGPSTHTAEFQNHSRQSRPRAQSGFKIEKKKLLTGRNFYRLWASHQSCSYPSSPPSLSLSPPSFLSASTSFLPPRFIIFPLFRRLPSPPLPVAESLSSRLQKWGDSFTLYQTCMAEQQRAGRRERRRKER